MIRSIIPGDITAESNRSDIIIGMNADLISVRGIGYPFVREIKQRTPLQMGSVLSFDFDNLRKLHMIICHKIGPGGWFEADRYVRIGMDHLWQQEKHAKKKRQYSCVQIGTGVMGKRFHADAKKLHAAIANSFLDVDLYVWLPDGEGAFLRGVLDRPDIIELRMWTPDHGEQKVPAVM